MPPLLIFNNFLPSLSTLFVFFDPIKYNVGIDCTKAKKAYFLWVTHQDTPNIMPKYQYDILLTAI